MAFTAAVTISSLTLGLNTVRAESLAPGPQKQDQLPEKPSNRYASKEETQKVIGLLKSKLRDDQVTTDKDDLLGHGHSANTYHCQCFFSSRHLSADRKAAAVPDVVIYAESTEDVSAVVKLAHQYRIPVTPFSGGTSLEGHITCPFGGICIDLSRMDKIIEVHEADSDAVVQAGVQWEALNEELVDRGLKLFFPLDPGPSACIGGMMATGCR